MAEQKIIKNGEHFEKSRNLGEFLHSVWKKSYLKVIRQYDGL